MFRDFTSSLQTILLLVVMRLSMVTSSENLIMLLKLCGSKESTGEGDHTALWCIYADDQ